MTMDSIPPYISVALLNQRDESQEKKNEHQHQTTITLVPKKRSFDVAFLISPPDDRKSPETTTVRSAFKKVGIPTNSRTPSPTVNRTPSPNKDDGLCHKKIKDQAFPFMTSTASNYRPKETANVFPTNNFLNPAGVSRSTFLPTPIFSPTQLLPNCGFVTSSLLPPSLAALTLPAQNVCAKCNVSFRMTSDLVYHMRSHHKHDHATPEQLRRKRELDKLKCPVCNESFRERHHLTRHMTAHQDKEGDHVDAMCCKTNNRFCAEIERQ